MTPERNSWFVSCACDRKFVQHTAVMLTSLSINGDVPDAIILVTAFQLNEEDKDVLRAGAGRMAGRMRFIDVTREMLCEVDPGRFTDEYPVAVLGRLFVPYHVEVVGARLLTLDSDMIINSSLKPLFQRDLLGEFFAAFQDYPRHYDLNYFNSGMMLVEVDGYKFHDIGRRSLLWLSAQLDHPQLPDQDALNHVVGDCWCRLERTWNYYDNVNASTEDFEAAAIAHFASNPKPWDESDHPGRPLYNRYLSILLYREGCKLRATAAPYRDLIATAYEVFLGRSLESESVVAERGRWPPIKILQSVVQSSEFTLNVVGTIAVGKSLPDGIFQGVPTPRQKFWVLDELPLSAEAREHVVSADTWLVLLSLILRDGEFCRAMEISQIIEAWPSSTFNS